MLNDPIASLKKVVDQPSGSFDAEDVKKPRPCSRRTLSPWALRRS